MTKDIDRIEAASRLYDVAYQAGQRELMRYCEAALDRLAEDGRQTPNGEALGAVQGGLFGEGVGTRANGG